MGRLAGFSADDIVRRLRRAGFAFDRQRRGSHQIWRNPTTRARTTVPRHPGDLPGRTVAAIIRDAGLSVDDFLSLRLSMSAALDRSSEVSRSWRAAFFMLRAAEVVERQTRRT